MRKIRLLVLFFLVFAVTSDARVRICSKTGLFNLFLGEKLRVTGCGPNDVATLAVGPGGLVLKGLGPNKEIPLKVVSDTKATGTNITAFGQGGHNGTFELRDGSVIEFDLQNQSGGRCSAIAAGGPRCIYEVKESKCANDLLPGDKICGPCKRPCEDFGDKLITIFLQGTPTIECNVKLKLDKNTCINCNGKKGFSPKSS